jgi:dolichyl-phosphate-mannose-protein mannosyltransferase
MGDRSFTFSWWFWLAMTGMGLGCTVSCKWVGLFVIATIGCSTLYQLWQLWGDLHITQVKQRERIAGRSKDNSLFSFDEQSRFMQHFLARGVCLILLPIVIYMGSFCVHFYLLPKSGSGDSMMSSVFQHSLIGNEIQDSPFGKCLQQRKRRG